MAIPSTEIERLARLEVQQQNTDALTKRLVESQDTIAQSLQELVAIHREGVARQEADHNTIKRHESEIQELDARLSNLNKHFWRYVWIGTGVFLTLVTLTRFGLLPTLIGVIVK